MAARRADTADRQFVIVSQTGARRASLYVKRSVSCALYNVDSCQSASTTHPFEGCVHGCELRSGVCHAYRTAFVEVNRQMYS